jgi:uncharacterized protein YndB with AHSA1/START domain
MSTLSVEGAVEIRASPSRVWEVLTKPEFTREWAEYFGASGPIEPEWALGSTVLWRNAEGHVYVDGVVTAVDPEHLLRFTVSDVFNPGLPPTSGRAEDDLTQTYALTGDGAQTILSTAHGDFAKIVNGDRLYPSWNGSGTDCCPGSRSSPSEARMPSDAQQKTIGDLGQASAIRE